MNYFVWNADPIFFQIGSYRVYWYGLIFVSSFFVGWAILRWIYKREGKDPNIIENLPFYLLIGAAVGARLVHCFFYEPDIYLANPLRIFAIWEGGLASHGGMIGVLLVLWFFAKYHKESYMWLIARISIVGALTAFAIRIGNFINSEIIGLPAQVPWAVIFQRVDNIPRHPVQLYEALAYISIFILLLFVYIKSKPSFSTKVLPPLFLVTLFTARFFLEYFKTRQADYTTNLPFTTGQLLSMPFILIGIIWLILALKSTKEKA